MRKFKYIVTALLALIIVAGGALLPWGVSIWQDKTVHGVVQYREDNYAALDTGKLSDYDKLYLLRRDAYIIADATQADMSLNEVRSAAFSGLSKYVSAGVIEDLSGFLSERENFSYTPRLYLPDTSSESGNIFWSVYMYNPQTDASIELLIDDASGVIYSIQYASPNAFPQGDPYLTLQYVDYCYFQHMDLLNSQIYTGETDGEYVLAVDCREDENQADGLQVQLICGADYFYTELAEIYTELWKTYR